MTKQDRLDKISVLQAKLKVTDDYQKKQTIQDQIRINQYEIDILRIRDLISRIK